MIIVDELLTILRKRSRDFARTAKTALTDELYHIYRAKASEAEAIYIILLNMRKEALKNIKADEGEWKKVSDRYPKYVCTACNHLGNNRDYRYCPYCGAKMRGGEE